MIGEDNKHPNTDEKNIFVSICGRFKETVKILLSAVLEHGLNGRQITFLSSSNPKLLASLSIALGTFFVTITGYRVSLHSGR
jgi:hypothetical protein